MEDNKNIFLSNPDWSKFEHYWQLRPIKTQVKNLRECFYFKK